MSGVDTWWQTETGGIMISPIAFVTLLNQLMQLYRYRIQPVLMDENRNEIEGNQVGKLCIKFPWPGIARTIWGDHQRYKDTYFSKELISPATGLYEMK
jgi:acetyl-CoA synthetase